MMFLLQHEVLPKSALSIINQVSDSILQCLRWLCQLGYAVRPQDGA